MFLFALSLEKKRDKMYRAAKCKVVGWWGGGRGASACFPSKSGRLFLSRDFVCNICEGVDIGGFKRGVGKNKRKKSNLFCLSFCKFCCVFR